MNELRKALKARASGSSEPCPRTANVLGLVQVGKTCPPRTHYAHTHTHTILIAIFPSILSQCDFDTISVLHVLGPSAGGVWIFGLRGWFDYQEVLCPGPGMLLSVCVSDVCIC